MDRKELKAALAVFGLSFGAYMFTATPEIAAGDAGELVSAAWLLGVPHPPGYPLFCVMGKAFSFLPFGNVAYRFNLMSGFFSAAGVLFVYMSSLLLVKRTGGGNAAGAAISAGAALAVGFSGTYWSQATYTEVYPIQAALCAAAVYCALRAGDEPGFRFVYLACLLFGLAVSGHYAAVLFAPALFVYLMLRTGPWDYGKAAVSVLSLMLGLSTLGYIPPRAAAGTAVNWGGAHSAGNFLRHVTRASYGDISSIFTGFFTAGPVWYQSGAVTVLAVAVLAVIAFVAARKKWGVPSRPVVLGYAALGATLLYMAVVAAKGVSLERLAYFFTLASSDAWPFLLALSAAGIAVLAVRDRKALYLLGLALMVVLVVSVYRVPIETMTAFQSFSEKFFMPSVAICGILSAVGLSGAAGLAARAGMAQKTAAFIFAMAVLALAGWLFADNFSERDQSRSFYAYDYSENLLRGLEQDAAFMVEGDNVPSLMAYQKLVEKKRPDVDIFELTGHLFPPFDEARRVYDTGIRPMYHSEAGEPNALPGITMTLSGMVSRLPGTPVRIADPWEYYFARIDAGKLPYADYATRETAANYLFFRAIRLMSERRDAEAMNSLEDTLRAGYDMPWALYIVGVTLRDRFGQADRPLSLFRRAQALSPGYADAYVEEARTLLMTGEPGKLGRAADALETARRIAPGNADVYCLLAEAARRSGDQAAEEAMRNRCDELSGGGARAGG